MSIIDSTIRHEDQSEVASLLTRHLGRTVTPYATQGFRVPNECADKALEFIEGLEGQELHHHTVTFLVTSIRPLTNDDVQRALCLGFDKDTDVIQESIEIAELT